MFIAGLIVLVGIFYLSYYFKEDLSDNIDGKDYMRAKNWVGEGVDKVLLDLDSYNVNISYEYSFDVMEGMIISQSIIPGEEIKNGEIIDFVVSKGSVPLNIYSDFFVNDRYI